MKRILERVSDMSPQAFSVLRGGLLVACTLLACSLIIRAFAGPLSASTYILHKYSQTLSELPFIVLFEAVFGSAIIEEQVCKRKD